MKKSLLRVVIGVLLLGTSTPVVHAQGLITFRAYGKLVDSAGKDFTGQFHMSVDNRPFALAAGAGGIVFSNELIESTVNGQSVQAQYTAFEGLPRNAVYDSWNKEFRADVALTMLINRPSPYFVQWLGGNRVLPNFRGRVVARNVAENGLEVCKISYTATTLDGTVIPFLSTPGELTLYKRRIRLVNGRYETYYAPGSCDVLSLDPQQ